MCKYIKSDRTQCKYKPNQEWCGYHDPSKHSMRVARGKASRKTNASNNNIIIKTPQLFNPFSDIKEEIENIKLTIRDEMEKMSRTLKNIHSSLVSVVPSVDSILEMCTRPLAYMLQDVHSQIQMLRTPSIDSDTVKISRSHTISNLPTIESSSKKRRGLSFMSSFVG